MQKEVGAGMLVRDDHNRLGIVRGPDKRPSKKWLREQLHPISEEDAGATWWAVITLGGGLILSPEPLLSPIRRATYEDFIEAVDQANDAGRKSLAGLFPEYVERARSTVGQRGAADEP